MKGRAGTSPLLEYYSPAAPAGNGSPRALHRVAIASLLIGLGVFLVLGSYQLELPGLHYDEAKEAGVNAMQLAAGQAVTAFRDATVRVGPWRIPLMVQDYIGALNVLLAVPFLKLGGVNVVALRWLPLVIGAVTLMLAWRVAYLLGGAWAAATVAILMAVNPSFVFWSRQGIFVTNVTALLFMAALLTGLLAAEHRTPLREREYLWLTAFLCGLGVYAKLSFVWAIGAMVGVAVAVWVLEQRSRRAGAGGTPAQHPTEGPAPSGPANTLTGTSTLTPWRVQAGTGRRGASDPRLRASPAVTWLIAAACFLLPLIPLISFNLRTEGTITTLFGNLDRSYYGVDNSAYLANLGTRITQVGSLLRGDQFWYLGEVVVNRWAPWLAFALVLAGLMWGRRRGGLVMILGLLALVVAQSAFTVSDLFITHFALLVPLVPLAGALAYGSLVGNASGVVASRRQRAAAAAASVLLLGWTAGDLVSTVRYHRALGISGGYGAHTDAIYAFAGYLDELGEPEPMALDWGIDAPVRFLTAGRVSPVEVFGYESLDAPDAGFAGRIEEALGRGVSVLLAHGIESVVFHGRRDALDSVLGQRGFSLRRQAAFAERNGRSALEVYRAVEP